VETIGIAAEAKIRVIAIEAEKTLLLERDAIVDFANRAKISIVARYFAHDAVIRVYDEAGNVIETHEQTGQFKEW